MSNIIDINDRIKSKNESSDDSYDEDSTYAIGSQFLILDVHDQLTLIKNYNAKLIHQGLTQENIEVASLSRLITVADFLVNGIIFPFGGFKVNILKRVKAGQTQYAVMMTRIESDDAHTAIQEGRAVNKDFVITICFDEGSIDSEHDSEIDLQTIDFDSMDFSQIKKETMHKLISRMATSAKIHGGVCFLAFDDKVVFAELPFGSKHKIVIAFNCNHIRKRV